MATDDELRRMHGALDAVLKHCIRDRKAFARKEADHLKPDLERVQQSLAAEMKKRGLLP